MPPYQRRSESIGPGHKAIGRFSFISTLDGRFIFLGKITRLRGVHCNNLLYL